MFAYPLCGMFDQVGDPACFGNGLVEEESARVLRDREADIESRFVPVCNIDVDEFFGVFCRWRWGATVHSRFLRLC